MADIQLQVEEKVKTEGWRVIKGPAGNTIFVLPKK